MISPVRLRANASGLTRMRVLSMGVRVLRGFLIKGFALRSPPAAHSGLLPWVQPPQAATSARRYFGGGSASATACSDEVPPRRRRRAEGGGTAPVSASQYGHSFQAGSIGLPHE